MKVRGLKQFLHWIFLVIGIISLLTLAISVNTYLGYAEEGYGLKMSFDDAWLNDDWLVLKFYFENPGQLEIQITEGNLTLSQTHIIPQSRPNNPVQQLPAKLLAEKNTSVIIWVPISGPDLDSIKATGLADLEVELLILVPDRYVTTEITFQATVEVEL